MSIASRLGTQPDSLDNVSLWQGLIDRGLGISESGFSFTDLDKLVAGVLAKYPAAKVHDFRIFNRRFVIETDDFVIFVPNAIAKRCSLHARNHAIILEVLQCVNGLVTKLDDDSVSVIYYYPSKGDVGTHWITLPIAEIPTIIPELYPGLDIQNLAEEFKKSSDNILLLYGIPGVGKTSLLKYLLATRVYKNVAYVKDTEVMTMGEFWSEVAATKHDMIIFDDLDFALSPRTPEDGGFVSNLLSYSDGIFSTKTKIVITTNQPIERIDGALVRPGRCFDFLTLEPLTFEEGRVVWLTILGMDPEQYETLYRGSRVVSQAAIMSDYRRLLLQSQDRHYIKRGNRRYSIEQKMHDCGVAVFHPERKGGFAK